MDDIFHYYKKVIKQDFNVNFIILSARREILFWNLVSLQKSSFFSPFKQMLLTNEKNSDDLQIEKFGLVLKKIIKDKLLEIDKKMKKIFLPIIHSILF